MKKNLLLLIIILIIPAILITSCKDDDDDEKGPAYAGKWMAEYYSEANQTNQRETLTLTETTFENIISIPVQNIWVKYIGLKGTTVVTGEDAVITFTHAGTTNTDGDIAWQDSESVYFKTLMAGLFYGQTTVTAEFAVSGNILTLKLDENGDDKFSTDETTEYTKQ